MNYSLSERLIWYSMGKPVFNFLKRKCPNTSIAQWKKRAKKRYKGIIRELDDIGSIRKNSLRASLAGGSLWIAIYETSGGKMDEALFAEMVLATLDSKLMQKMYKSKDIFSNLHQQQMIKNNEKSNAVSDSPYNWKTELIPGRDQDEYTVIFHRCGLCALGKKLGHPELIAHMCKMDYLTFDLMGAVLFRSQTLAEGGDFCDFYICKKGSKWEKEKQNSIS